MAGRWIHIPTSKMKSTELPQPFIDIGLMRADFSKISPEKTQPLRDDIQAECAGDINACSALLVTQVDLVIAREENRRLLRKEVEVQEQDPQRRGRSWEQCEACHRWRELNPPPANYRYPLPTEEEEIAAFYWLRLYRAEKRAHGRLIDAISPFAQALSLSFNDKLERSQLPNEILFLIYESLVDSYDPRILRILFWRSNGWEKLYYGMAEDWEVEPSLRNLTYYLWDGFVGQQAATRFGRAAFKRVYSDVPLWVSDENRLMQLHLDPFNLRLSALQFVRKVDITWRSPLSEQCKQDIRALQLIEPKQGLEITITLSPTGDWDSIDDKNLEHTRALLDLFKPAHKHLTRNYTKSDFLKWKEQSSYRRPPYILFLIEFGVWSCELIFELDVANYFWVESADEEAATWKHLCDEYEEAKRLLQEEDSD